FRVMKGISDQIVNVMQALAEEPAVTDEVLERESEQQLSDDSPGGTEEENADEEYVAPLDEVHNPSIVRYDFENDQEPRLGDEEDVEAPAGNVRGSEVATTRSGREVRSTQRPDFAYATRGSDPEADAYVDELTQLF
ncbi:MAG: hypothetical protein ACK559_01240, partial [bacterium]